MCSVALALNHEIAHWLGPSAPRPGQTFWLLELKIEPRPDVSPPDFLMRGELPCAPKTEHCLEDAPLDARVLVNLVDYERTYTPPSQRYLGLSNGSRLKLRRDARGRKAVEPQIKRLAGEARQFLPTCERPTASSGC